MNRASRCLALSTVETRALGALIGFGRPPRPFDQKGRAALGKNPEGAGERHEPIRSDRDGGRGGATGAQQRAEEASAAL